MKNKYQENNLKWWNHNVTDRENFLTDNWAYSDIQRFMECTSCGKRTITKPIIKFFRNQVDQVLCWNCQQSNKTNK